MRDYNNFTRKKFGDFEDPRLLSTAIPKDPRPITRCCLSRRARPFNYYSRDYEKDFSSYASGVLIMDKCADLPAGLRFSFVRGLVDSQDLSLNISREMLQHDRQLKLIAGRLEKKFIRAASMLRNKREQYEAFFKKLWPQLKYGVYARFRCEKRICSRIYCCFIRRANRRWSRSRSMSAV